MEVLGFRKKSVSLANDPKYLEHRDTWGLLGSS